MDVELHYKGYVARWSRAGEENIKDEGRRIKCGKIAQLSPVCEAYDHFHT